MQKLVPRITVIRVLLTSAFLLSLFWLLFDPHEHIVAEQTTDDDYVSTFVDTSGVKIHVPIPITIKTMESKLAGGNLTNGKFEPGQILETTFEDTQLFVGNKTISVIDALKNADDANAKSANIMLDVLADGKEYGKDPTEKDDLGARCSALFNALGHYLTRADTAGMFWSFLLRYGEKIDKGRCVGPPGNGTRQAELLSYGLTP